MELLLIIKLGESATLQHLTNIASYLLCILLIIVDTTVRICRDMEYNEFMNRGHGYYQTYYGLFFLLGEKLKYGSL